MKSFDTLDSLPSVGDDAMDRRSAVGLSSRVPTMGVWEQKPVLQAFYNGKTVEFFMRIDACPETAIDHPK